MKKLALEVLRDEKAPVIALITVALRQYGEEALSVQPEFLRKDLETDFNVKLPDLVSDKIQTAITILITDAFESQHEVFETCCHLLNGSAAGFDDVAPLEAEEIAAALAHYSALVGPTPNVSFSDDVRAYVGIVFHNYGMSQPPSIFPTAIMPESKAENATQGHTAKDTALNEMYNSRLKALNDYMTSME